MSPNGVRPLVKPKGNRSAISYLVTEVMALSHARRDGAYSVSASRVSTGVCCHSIRLLKDHSFVSVWQDAVFHVPAHSARQDGFFDVAALLDQVVDGVAMVDADDILFDDGAIVEYLGNVVSGGADE